MNKHNNTPQETKMSAFPFNTDTRTLASCFVRHHTYNESADQQWQIFGFGESSHDHAGNVKPLIKLYDFVHKNLTEMVKAEPHIEISFVFDQVITRVNQERSRLFTSTEQNIIKSATIVIGLIKQGSICLADRGVSFSIMVVQHASKIPRVIPIIVPDTSTSPSDTTIFKSSMCGIFLPNSRAILSTSPMQTIGRNDVFLSLLSKRTTELNDIWKRISVKLTEKKSEPCSGVIIDSYEKSNSTPVSEIRRFSSYVTNTKSSHIPLIHFTITLLKKIYAKISTYSALCCRFIVPQGSKITTTTWYRTTAKFFLAFTKSFIGQKISFFTRSIARIFYRICFLTLRTVILITLYISTRLLNPLKRIIQALKKLYLQCSLTKKIALFIALCALIIFITILFVRSKNNTLQTTQLTIQQTLQQFETKRLIAESKFVFNDAEGARTALRDAEQLLSSLPHNTSHQLEIITNLKEKISSLRAELLKITHITFRDADIVHTSETQHNTERDIASINNHLLIWDKFAITDLTTSRNTIFSNPLGEQVHIIFGDSTIMFQENSLIKNYEVTSGKLSQSELLFSNPLISAHVYDGRLYGIDAGGIITRHEPSSSGFARGTSWQKVSTVISEPMDLEIDGSIYILDGGARIHKFFKGEPTQFDVSSIDPQLHKAPSMWTDSNSPYLYILEPSENRLVVLDKNGKMKQQYVFDIIPEKFAINEKERKGYILTSQFTYSFPL